MKLNENDCWLPTVCKFLCQVFWDGVKIDGKG